MIDHIHDFMERWGKNRGIVAFSGGGDSLCLLHLLCRWMNSTGSNKIEAVHVDHGLRQNSGEEALRIQKLAESLGVTCHLLKVAVARGNVQEEARKSRYRALGKQCRDASASWLATAHTLTDQSETLLMRVIRGTGVRGLGGMREVGPNPFCEGALMIRPLLKNTREEVQSYLKKHELQPIQDDSNSTDRYLRNRIRHHLLPLLRQENPAIEQTLARLAQNCQEESDALDSWVELIENEKTVLFKKLPTGVLHRLIQHLYRQEIGHHNLDRHHVERIAQLLTDQTGSRAIDLPHGKVERCYDKIYWVKKNACDPLVELQSIQIDDVGEVCLSDGRALSVKYSDNQEKKLLLGRIQFPLTVRSVQPGDRMAIGNGKHKKVARILIDAKVPVRYRRVVPVVLMEGELLLIVGVQRAAGWGPTLNEKGLEVTLTKKIN